MSAYIKKTERAQINDLMIHLKLLEKQEQANPKTNGRREIIKIRAEINKIETKKKPYKELMKQKVGSLHSLDLNQMLHFSEAFPACPSHYAYLIPSRSRDD
jgi:hypothetical protein